MNILTKEQLQSIQERLLYKYDLKYDELRNELLDHMACEIEEMMHQGETYDEATILVFRKWNVRLIANQKGIYKGIPHFIVNQLNSAYRKIEIISFVAAIVLGLLLLIGTYYFTFNSVVLLGSLFTIHVVGVFMMYRESKDIQDYRRDFFRVKSVEVLFKSGLALAVILLFTLLWGTDATPFSFEVLVMYYFIFHSFLLFRFIRYCKYQKFKIAK
ncbi:hypothetical protein [Myroides fluvii]|uniref:hypothetical protein n=1 Tax=Myroides fluvii TaxID=2572594 RepID=UPI00131E4BB6|nr:hypothetical protein [Myroides fluvii]